MGEETCGSGTLDVQEALRCQCSHLIVHPNIVVRLCGRNGWPLGYVDQKTLARSCLSWGEEQSQYGNRGPLTCKQATAVFCSKRAIWVISRLGDKAVAHSCMPGNIEEGWCACMNRHCQETRPRETSIRRGRSDPSRPAKLHPRQPLARMRKCAVSKAVVNKHDGTLAGQ